MHFPILHSMSKRQLSPSNAQRYILGEEVGTSDGSTLGFKDGIIDG